MVREIACYRRNPTSVALEYNKDSEKFAGHNNRQHYSEREFPSLRKLRDYSNRARYTRLHALTIDISASHKPRLSRIFTCISIAIFNVRQK